MGISAVEEDKIRTLMRDKTEARRKRQEQERDVSGNLFRDSQAQELSGTGLSFKIIDGAVELQWATRTESDTKGFLVKRRKAKTNDYEVIASHEDWEVGERHEGLPREAPQGQDERLRGHRVARGLGPAPEPGQAGGGVPLPGRDGGGGRLGVPHRGGGQPGERGRRLPVPRGGGVGGRAAGGRDRRGGLRGLRRAGGRGRLADRPDERVLRQIASKGAERDCDVYPC